MPSGIEYRYLFLWNSFDLFTHVPQDRFTGTRVSMQCFQIEQIRTIFQTFKSMAEKHIID